MGISSKTADYLALDLGAESGRGVVGRFDGDRLTLNEVHRFPNGPVRALDTLHWDVLRLFEAIKAFRLNKADDWMLYPVWQVRPNARWYRGRVILLGDAAHAVCCHRDVTCDWNTDLTRCLPVTSLRRMRWMMLSSSLGFSPSTGMIP